MTWHSLYENELENIESNNKLDSSLNIKVKSNNDLESRTKNFNLK